MATDPLVDVPPSENDDVILLAEVRRLAESGEARTIRKSARISIPEMAAALKVAPITISRWERGVRRPKGDAALRWLASLWALQT